MLRLVEIIFGVVLIYVSLSAFSTARRFKAVVYGLLAMTGLVLAVHGILLLNVPDFFTR